MSGFVVGTGGRLTARRLVTALVVGSVACSAIATFALLVGIDWVDGSWRVDLLAVEALSPGSLDHRILWVRVPRVLAALLVGGALGAAGCALQALLRNPLAEPFTLGISSGSALAAVIAIRFGIEDAFGLAGVGGAALLGASGTLFVVWQLARIGRHLPPATLVLAGVTVSMFCAAASVLVQHTSDFVQVSHMLRWMMGGLDRELSAVGYAAIPIGLGLVILLAHARELNALSAGPEVAASLGVDVPRTQTVVFVTSSLLVGTAIALAGPIGFIGLIVPHALRAVLGSDHRVLVPLSIFGGAILLVSCDTLARTIRVPDILPTGAVTAVLGGPFFIAILIGQKRRAALWGG